MQAHSHAPIQPFISLLEKTQGILEILAHIATNGLI
jgi:hypothetical protein